MAPGAVLVGLRGLPAQLLKLPRQCVLCPQDSPGDNECVMELEGREVVVEAQVECEQLPDTRCRVTCQQQQVWITGTWVGWLPTSAGCTTLTPAQALTLRPRQSRYPISDL